MRSERALPLLASLAIVTGLSFFVAVRLRVSSDITDFFPPAERRDVALISREITRSPISRSMTYCLSGGSPSELRDAASGLEQALRNTPGVEWVESGPDPKLEAGFSQLFFPHRYGFLSESPEKELPARLSDTGLADAAKRLRRQLASVAGPVIRPLASSDPLLILTDRIRALESALPNGLKVVDGQYFSLDDRYAVVFLGTEARAFDVPSQARLLERLECVSTQTKANLGFDLQLDVSGLNRFAVKMQETTQADILRITTISSAAILVVFFALYRSLRLLGLLFLPLAIGLLAGTSSCLLIFGRVHGLTLAFGTTLLGVCVDYPIHLINQYLFGGVQGPLASVRAVWPALRLGGLTTIVGFSCLALSSYPGIQEVALFAIFGVAAALASSRFTLPFLLPSLPPKESSLPSATSSLGRALWSASRWRRARYAILLSATAVVIAGAPRVKWSDTLRAMAVVDQTLAEEDQRVRERISDFEVGRFVVVTAQSPAEALKINDALAARLDQARAENALENYGSFHSILWSEDLQRRNLAAVRASGDLASRMSEALSAEGFKIGAFEAFRRDLAELPPPLGFDAFLASPLRSLARPFFFRSDQQVFLLSFLRAVRNPERLQELIAGLPGVVYLDQTEFLDRSYSDYRDQALRMILLGTVLVSLLILYRYQRFRLSASICLPALVACLATVGGLGLCGIPVTLMHVFALLLVFSMGTDYSIFLAEAEAKGGRQEVAALSICLSALFTVLAFGLLACSSSPALRDLGSATSVGVAMSFINALVFSPRRADAVAR